MKNLRLPGVVGLVCLLMLACGVASAASHAGSPAATYVRGELAVTLPYFEGQNVGGRLVTELLDPEEHVLARADREVDMHAGDGAWQQTMKPERAIAIEDLVWLRLRFRFAATGERDVVEGVVPMGEVLRRPVLRVLGQQEYLAGSHAAVRVIVVDSHNNDVALDGKVRVELMLDGERSLTLFAGRLNRRGTAEAQFRFPNGVTGSHTLRYVAETAIGSAELKQAVVIKDKASILLTTEKPMYQPGQTIHVRALALDRASHLADGPRQLTFELEDSRGNKVFRKATATDRFGVASAEFGLADEVNLGTYHLRALMGDAAGQSGSSNTAEVTLNVERYVLPKFKVEIEFDKKDGKARRDYRPGDHVTGTVRANYFFGKPVDHAEIAVKASSMDVTVFEAAAAKGTTDGEGSFHFDMKLPNYFWGRPLSGGSARVLVEATVKDAAEHHETRGEPITVSQSALLITAIPEGGSLIPHLDNEVYVVTSYADGTPAVTTLVVRAAGRPEQRLTSDNGGVALARIAAGDRVTTLQVEASDGRGNRTRVDVPMETKSGADQVLMRTDRAVLKVGDALRLKVLSTRERGTAYVDVVRNGQTVVTRDLTLEHGEAELTLTATPEMAGTLTVSAYVFGRDAQPVADSRLVFVQPADELKIEAKADAAVYKPGDEARVHFRVTNARGQGVSAALGLQVVDEAVFALAEKQPGFAKVFFYLEQEVMKPRYEIHSLSMEDAAEPVLSEQRERAAGALFAATWMGAPAAFDEKAGESLPQEKAAEYEDRYRAALRAQVEGLSRMLNERLAGRDAGAPLPKLFAQLGADGQVPRDAWGTPLRLDVVYAQRRNAAYRVRSAGPDRRFDSGDDLMVDVREVAGTVMQPSAGGGKVELRLEHDRGPMNGLAEIAGSVVDATGAVVPGCTVRLREQATGRTRSATSRGGGDFEFAGLTPGRYTLSFAARGFMELSYGLAVEARDRAVVVAPLGVGAAMETVTVEAMNAVEMPRGRIVGMAMGMGAAPAMMRDRSAMSEDGMEDRSVSIERKNAPAAGAHVRSYFPEALYINPEIVTDGDGRASITIPMADSITTWRMAMIASTEAGALGTGASSLKVFQDFFVDLDLPVTLTQGDVVALPVGVYNYTGGAGKVTLSLEPDEWYGLDNDRAQKGLAVDAGRVGAAQFRVRAEKIGKFKLTLKAHMDGAAGSVGRDDIVVREIEVIPNGREASVVFNGRLEKNVQHSLHFPKDSISDASSVMVRLYPGPLSQVIEGMDSILQMPDGCFEQTSSSTYPNVLALDYMKRTKKLTPEVHAKAEGYIANGYQRLLTFEVPGGGFSWFGQAPANKILTAYGLMEFNDMSKVYDVDPKLIARTRDWLVAQQQADGSWKPDTLFINEGATNRYNSNVLRITAYVAWALANTGYQGPAVEKAKQYIAAHEAMQADTYTLAVIANFAVDYGKDRDFTRQAVEALIDKRTEKDGQVFWAAEETGVYAGGTSAAIETTGLATQALLKWGQASEVARKALSYLAAKKQASGNWGTTQATIVALRALLLASEANAADVRGAVTVMLNGHAVETLQLTAENNDLLHQFVFKLVDASQPADVELKFEGTGGLAYQVAGRYFTPWEGEHEAEAMSIDVAYDRSTLAENDMATATATVRNNLGKTANMVMVDLGIPPGFELQTEDLEAYKEASAKARTGRLEKFSLTATQAILYFDSLGAKQTVVLKFRLRAKYPVRARTFESRVYEYYDPEVGARAVPRVLVVTGR